MTASFAFNPFAGSNADASVAAVSTAADEARSDAAEAASDASTAYAVASDAESDAAEAASDASTADSKADSAAFDMIWSKDTDSSYKIIEEFLDYTYSVVFVY